MLTSVWRQEVRRDVGFLDELDSQTENRDRLAKDSQAYIGDPCRFTTCQVGLLRPMYIYI